MEAQQPNEVYLEQIQQFSKELSRLKKISSLVAWSRLLAIISLVGGGWFCWHYSATVALALMVVLLILFFWLVSADSEISVRIGRQTQLIRINRRELDITAGKYSDLPGGNEFLPPAHEYAADLDLFGRASVYQYINRTTSSQGSRLLAAWLLHPTTVDVIFGRQEAVKELGRDIHFRQDLQSLGMQEPITDLTEKKLHQWLDKDSRFLGRVSWRLLRYLYPVITCGTLGLCIFEILPPSIFYLLQVLFLVFSLWVSNLVTLDYNQVNRMASEIDTLYQSIGLIERQPWQCSFLKGLQQQFASGNEPASHSIRQFKGILNRFDLRLNWLAFFPINTFFLGTCR